MTQKSPTYQPLASGKMLKAMVGIGTLCALLITGTYQVTLSQIEKNKAAALDAALFKVLPGIDSARIYNPPTTSTANFPTLYAGYQNGQIVAYAIPASGQGYADLIHILYGYDPEKEVIVGIQVLGSKETPGLGDKIEKDPNFLKNFEALSVSVDPAEGLLEQSIITVKNGEKKNPWEIDGITGATISSRAIGDMLAKSSKEIIPDLHRFHHQESPN